MDVPTLCRLRGTAAGMMCVVLWGCGKTESTEDTLAVSTPVDIHPAADSALVLEPYTGMWTMALLGERMRRAGMRVTRSDSVVTHDWFSVPGEVLTIARGELQVFFYADSAAAKLDYVKLDTLTAAPPGTEVLWSAVPVVMRSINLIAVYFSDSQDYRERVQNAILAGLAPPDTTK